MLNGSFSAVSKPIFAMDFQLELGFYSTPALPRSVCCPVVALQQNPEPFAQVILARDERSQPQQRGRFSPFALYFLATVSVQSKQKHRISTAGGTW